MRKDRSPVLAISVAVSLVAHAAAAWFLSERASLRRVDFGEERVVSVRLFQPAPPAPEPVAAPPPPSPVKPPPPRPSPKPVEEKPAPKQIPVAKAVESAPPEPTVSAASTISAPVMDPAPPPPAPVGIDRDERAEYVHYVGGLVRGQKRYPRLARKRKITGEVLVEVEIGSDGELKAVRPVSESPRVLLRATEEAIRRAAPFRSPPGGSIAFRLPLAYDLKF